MSNSVGGLGVGLSLVCGCLVLAFVGQLYYLLWLKKKVANREEEEVVEVKNKSGTNYAKGLFGFMCWKSNNISAIEPSLGTQVQPDLEMGSSVNNNNNIKESVESELMRIHNLAGPPRFLFTIKEETKEDLESEDGKSRKGSRTGSLSELILASPRLTSPSNIHNLDSYHQLGFNPLFEASSAEAELSRLRSSSSPPPKFKFLRDAEEKLIRRLVKEAEKKGLKEIEVKSVNSGVGNEEELIKGSFMGFIVGVKNKEGDHHQLPVQYPSSSSQVVPLDTSPTTLRPDVDQKHLQNYCIS